MKNVYYLNQLGLICALGNNLSDITHNFLKGNSGIALTDNYSPNKVLPLGCVATQTLPPLESLPLPHRSRNNQLALAALEQIRPALLTLINKYGAHRIGIVVGTSTSGIFESEQAFKHYAQHEKFPPEFHYNQQELGSPALALAETLGITGPAYTHSSACASSGKAMASAARLINLGICDAVITGGVDSLCQFTVAGFSSLESVSHTLCNPMSKNRSGINIGEGAALFLMSKEPSEISLRGWGESSDAYHISSPDPAGTSAKIAIEQALSRADISASDIDYINMHGTATLQNDSMESNAIHALFGNHTPVSSTKPLTGHTLGASSAIEAALCWLAMQARNKTGICPPHLWDGIADPQLPELHIAEMNYAIGRPIHFALSNSFAFGGSNVTLILGRE